MTKTISRRFVTALAVLSLATFAACGGGEDAKPAETPAPAPEPAPAPAPDTAAAPAAATFACIAGDANAGKLKYAQLCASCHGATGAGDGVASAGLMPKPAKHNDGNYMNPLTNEHLVKVITEGGMAVGKSAQMAPWGAALGAQGVLDVVAFVRTLADPPYACP